MNQELENVTEQFRKLPGIGVKSARRLAYFMLERPESGKRSATVQSAAIWRLRILVISAAMQEETILSSAS